FYNSVAELRLIRKAPQILIDKNTTYPIEYHLFFAIFGQNQLLNQYCVWKRIYSGLCPLPPSWHWYLHGISTNK
ncbi:hypothetical protein, partial [Phocaeicola vulgatus]|uniref:hypothetical protein n=1 Tax=Phocaeicola vulgatus TaxID=821 RepID=UPI001C6FFBDE